MSEGGKRWWENEDEGGREAGAGKKEGGRGQVKEKSRLLERDQDGRISDGSLGQQSARGVWKKGCEARRLAAKSDVVL